VVEIAETLHYHVIKYRATCGSADTPLGVMSSALECAKAVADTGSRMFTYGTGPNEGVCHGSRRISPECPEGWETAFANTYEVIAPMNGRKSQCNRQYVGAILPDLAEIVRVPESQNDQVSQNNNRRGIDQENENLIDNVLDTAPTITYRRGTNR
jgi:hypothetical protein